MLTDTWLPQFPLQPAAHPPPPHKTVTFQDEWYLAVLFLGMKLAKVKKKKNKRNQGIDFPTENIYAEIDWWQ